jgi:2-keto-4-pentenoate hydratase
MDIDQERDKSMRSAYIREAARLLVESRLSGQLVTKLPDDSEPTSAAEAYAIQKAVIGQVGPVGAWKVGPVPTESPVRFAPILAGTIVDSPATLRSMRLAMVGIEAEVAFRLKHPLSASQAPFSRSAVLDAIGSAHAAIEIVDTRYEHWQSMSAFSILADNLCSGALVIGESRAEWLTPDLSNTDLHVFVDGALAATPRQNPGGDPIDLLRQLAGHCAEQNLPLEAGCIATTGSWTGLLFVPRDTRVEVRSGSVTVASVLV